MITIELLACAYEEKGGTEQKALEGVRGGLCRKALSAQRLNMVN